MTEARRRAPIAVALSGGGHRTALFCLGALLYLVDSERSKQVGSIASVSGGSLTNGWIALRAPFHTIEGSEFRDLVAPLVSRLCSEGTFQGRRLSKAWRNTMGIVLIAAFAAFGIQGLSRWVRYGVFLGAIAIWARIWIWPLFGTTWARLYGWFFAWSAVGALVTWWVVPLSYDGALGWWERIVRTASSPPGRLGLFLASLVAWAGLVAAHRGRVCASAFRERLFDTEDGSVAELRQIRARPEPADGVDHVFCATDLQSGEHVYFGRGFIYGYRFGKGDPADLPLHEAVQASANLPFAFPPKRISTAAHAFAYESETCPRGEDRLAALPPSLVLTDGGVYDNMADEWARGFSKRTDCWRSIGAEHHEPEQLVVVNASAGLPMERVRRLGLPLIGEILGLLKIKDVLYDQTTAHRRSAMVTAFDAAELAGQGLRGALVSIAQSPFGTATYFAGQGSGTWPHRAARGHRVIELLKRSGEDPEAWKANGRANSKVPTVLCAMGEADTVALLRHGYLLAMANLHVILGTPLPTDLPDGAHFRSLAMNEPNGYRAWRFVPDEDAVERVGEKDDGRSSS